MFNLQTLTAKARELRGNVVKATTTKGTCTMTPFTNGRAAQTARAHPADPAGLGFTLVGYCDRYRLAYQ